MIRPLLDRLSVVTTLVISSTAYAQPGPNDAKVEWTATYPKKVAPNLVMKGTVTFANGWSSADNKVVVTIAPSSGGAAQFYTANIVNGG